MHMKNWKFLPSITSICKLHIIKNVADVLGLGIFFRLLCLELHLQSNKQRDYTGLYQQHQQRPQQQTPTKIAIAIRKLSILFAFLYRFIFLNRICTSLFHCEVAVEVLHSWNRPAKISFSCTLPIHFQRKQ